MNRLIWDFNNADGYHGSAGHLQGEDDRRRSWSDTQPLDADDRSALDATNGVTAADLREQYEHNDKMRDMATEVGRVANRIRQARTRLRKGGSADSLARVDSLAVTLFGPTRAFATGARDFRRRSRIWRV